MKNITDVLKDLTKNYISKETLASKMGVSLSTIIRWQNGATKPSFAEVKLLNQIHKGYKKKGK